MSTVWVIPERFTVPAEEKPVQLYDVIDFQYPLVAEAAPTEPIMKITAAEDARIPFKNFSILDTYTIHSMFSHVNTHLCISAIIYKLFTFFI